MPLFCLHAIHSLAVYSSFNVIRIISENICLIASDPHPLFYSLRQMCCEGLSLCADAALKHTEHLLVSMASMLRTDSLCKTPLPASRLLLFKPPVSLECARSTQWLIIDDAHILALTITHLSSHSDSEFLAKCKAPDLLTFFDFYVFLEC